jgi:pilus assembly protein CpaC
MHPTKREHGWLIGILLLSLWAGGQALGQEPAPPPRPEPTPGRAKVMIVPIGGAQQLGMTSGKVISNVFLSGEGVIRVAPDVNAKFVVVSGLAAGTVRLRLTDVDNVSEEFEITVQLDVAYLKSILAQTVKTANVDVIATPNRTVILTGWVAKPDDVDTIVKITQSILGASASGVINAMRIGGVQQVQLDVTVASVNRTETRRRGFNWAYTGKDFSIGSILGGLTNSGTGLSGGGGGAGGAAISIAGASVTPTPPPSGANIIFGIVPAHFTGLLQALREEQLAKVLAEPKVIALSGRPAHFLSGGQQAVLSAQASIGGPGVDFKDVGTELDVLPIVMGNGRIYLEVHPRFRTVDAAKGISTSFGFTPGFDEESVRTAVEMEPGQTFAIGGLMQTTVTASSSKLPILGDLPYIGGAFSVVLHSEEEDELIILITPHLIDAQDCVQTSKRLPGRETRSPDDYELFLESLLEAPRGQRQVFENGVYKAAWRNDQTAKQYPCAEPLPKGQGRFGRGGCATGQCGTCGVGGRSSGMSGMPNSDGMQQRVMPQDVETLPAPAPEAPRPSIRTGARMMPAMPMSPAGEPITGY